MLAVVCIGYFEVVFGDVEVGCVIVVVICLNGIVIF